jgi:hypothetical protein
MMTGVRLLWTKAIRLHKHNDGANKMLLSCFVVCGDSVIEYLKECSHGY